MVDRLAGGGPVEVNDMQPRGTQGLPVEGDLHRVVGEYRFPGVVPLVQPDAPAPLEVDGGDNLDGSLTPLL